VEVNGISSGISTKALLCQYEGIRKGSKFNETHYVIEDVY
jgi:hypothetical protein